MWLDTFWTDLVCCKIIVLSKEYLVETQKGFIGSSVRALKHLCLLYHGYNIRDWYLVMEGHVVFML